MGQTCNCNYPSKVDEFTIEAPLKIKRKTPSRLFATHLQLNIIPDGEELLISPPSMSTIEQTPEIDPLSLVQSVEDDIYTTSTPTTSTNDYQMYNLNESGTISQNGTTQISLQISDQYQQVLSVDEHETNGKDEREKEDLQSTTKPNLLREDTKDKWDFTDMEYLGNDMMQELQSIHFHIAVGGPS